MEKARIGIVTVSDRASSGQYEDKGGPAIRAWFERDVIERAAWAAPGVAKVDDHIAVGL